MHPENQPLEHNSQVPHESNALIWHVQNLMQKPDCEVGGFGKVAVYLDQVATHAAYGALVGAALTKSPWGGLAGAVFEAGVGIVFAHNAIDGEEAECLARKEK